MNVRLREASSEQTNGEPRGARVRLSDTRHGLQQFVHGASHWMAVRRANILIEQETERLWFWRLVKLEVERARRHDTAFTVLCVRDPNTRALARMAQGLRPQLRGTDAVAVERDRVLIMLGDTTGSEARHVARRLADHFDRLPDEADLHEVEFPRDALTLGALIERLFSPETGMRLLPTG